MIEEELEMALSRPRYGPARRTRQRAGAELRPYFGRYIATHWMTFCCDQKPAGQ